MSESSVPVAPRAPWTIGSPTSVIWCHLDRTTLIAALVAVAFAWLVVLAQTLANLLPTQQYAPFDPVGWGRVMLEVGVLEPSAYLIGALVGLLCFLPISARSTLPIVLARAALAGFVGAVGLVAKADVEILTGTNAAALTGGSVAADLWMWPLAHSLAYTPLLLIGATFGWLLLRRAASTSAPVHAAQ